MKKILVLLLFIALVYSCNDESDYLYVPETYPTIAAAVEAAAADDTIIVAPGIYNENILVNKPVTIASMYLLSGDEGDIEQTIVDGQTNTVFTIEGFDYQSVSLAGLTIQNGDDGIMASAPVNLYNNLVRRCKDGIDYETGGSGEIRGNTFRDNLDDAIDLDGTLANVLIADNLITDNDDDGIEIRLHDYEGEYTFCRISGNVIRNNGEDGIQFIDYPGVTNRNYLLERNLIYGNAMVGVACMDNGDTKEDYRGAPIPESIKLVNNTIMGHQYGVTGGANMILLNNIISGAGIAGIRNCSGHSVIAYNLLYGNGTDLENSNEVGPGMLFADPELGDDLYPDEESPCIDQGTALFVAHNDTLLHMTKDQYEGEAPDLGALEFDPVYVRNLEAREDSLELARALKMQERFSRRLYAEGETEPVRSEAGEDAADDPAIWVNTEHPGSSLVLGTNKKGGLYVYDLQGRQLQVREVGLVNNVDLRDGFQLHNHEVVLVAASNRSDNTITLLTIDKTAGLLSDSLMNIRSTVDEVYGICMYRDPGHNYYVFVNGKGGLVEQWLITGGEVLAARLSRTFRVKSQPEGMVADDGKGILYLGVEQEGIYMMDAGVDVPVKMQKIPGSDTSNSAIYYDIEGLAIFSHQQKDYLLASSQGNFSYALFDVTGEPFYVNSFIIAEGKIDGVEETDGLEITTAALPGPYSDGLLVVQDGFNTEGAADQNQNFKYVAVRGILDILR